MEFWFAVKMIKGSIRRALYPLMGFIFGISSLILSISLGRGGENILRNDLNAIGRNRILLGGSFTEKDVRMIEELDFIEYIYLPEAREKKGEITWIAGSPKYLNMLGISQRLLKGEGIPEENALKLIHSIPDLKFRSERIRMVQSYKEKSPLEIMKNENRILLSMETFGIKEQKEIMVSFMEGCNPYEYIPIIKNILNRNHMENVKIEILETPALYKKIQDIKQNVKIILSLLAGISLVLGGTGITSLIASSVRERTYYIGILMSMGMPKSRICRIFLSEAGILGFIGGSIGVFLGIILSLIVGVVLNVPPIFTLGELTGGVAAALAIGIIFGISPSRKAVMYEIREIMGNL